MLFSSGTLICSYKSNCTNDSLHFHQDLLKGTFVFVFCLFLFILVLPSESWELCCGASLWSRIQLWGVRLSNDIRNYLLKHFSLLEIKCLTCHIALCFTCRSSNYLSLQLSMWFPQNQSFISYSSSVVFLILYNLYIDFFKLFFR